MTDYIPELKGSAYDGVTIRQLLTMTSGVKWNEDYSDPHSDVAQAGAACLSPASIPIVSYMRRLPRADPPGTRWVYKTGETDLAGVLVSNAVGKPLADYLSEKIWAPYGMDEDAAWVEDVGGHERGGCCISMTLRDYARFGQFMLDGGRAGGVQVLPPGWVADATAEHVKLPPERGRARLRLLLVAGRRRLRGGGHLRPGDLRLPEGRVVIAINSAWAHADDTETGRRRRHSPRRCGRRPSRGGERRPERPTRPVRWRGGGRRRRRGRSRARLRGTAGSTASSSRSVPRAATRPSSSTRISVAWR